MTRPTIEQLFADHSAWVFARCRAKVTAPIETIEDACQIAWTIAFRKHSEGTLDLATVRSYILKIAIREAIRLTQTDAHKAPIGRTEDALDLIASTIEDDDEFAAKLDSLDLRAFLADLTDHQRAIALLYAFGFTYEQIADRLGVSVTSVNKALVKIKNKGRKA